MMRKNKVHDRRKPPSRWLRLIGSPKLTALLLLTVILLVLQNRVLVEVEHQQLNGDNGLLSGPPQTSLTSRSVQLMSSKTKSMSSNSTVPAVSRSSLSLSTTTAVSEVEPSSIVMSNSTSITTTTKPRGAIVLLAGQRHATTQWNNITRFCLLRRSIRSIDMYINSYYGPYPIYVVVSRDYDEDPSGLDGPYTTTDRELIRSWATHSLVEFVEINMYSDDALEPGTTRDEIISWRDKGNDGAVKGRSLGYQSMCRLWSGRLQSMTFLDEFDYYMRLDDDSLMYDKPPWDPFLYMVDHSLSYVFRRYEGDMYGIHQLWMVASDHVLKHDTLSHKITRRKFLERQQGPDGTIVEFYSGTQPYNNFHISKVDFWRSPDWKDFMEDMDDEHLFYKYRVGDANVHAMALMMMGNDRIEVHSDYPCVHNVNDKDIAWNPIPWKEECDETEQNWYHQSSSKLL